MSSDHNLFRRITIGCLYIACVFLFACEAVISDQLSSPAFLQFSEPQSSELQPPEHKFSENPPSTLLKTRKAKLFVPADYNPENKYPLILLLHGFGSSADAQDKIFGLKDRVTAYQFILVMPQGSFNPNNSAFWNANNECCDFFEQKPNDINYISNVISEASKVVNVDFKKISLIGHSNGAYMAYSYACEPGHNIASVVALAGAIPIQEKPCEPDLPIKILHIHGTNDLIVPFTSNLDDKSLIPGLKVKSLGANASVEFWANKLNCKKYNDDLSNIDLLFFTPGLETEQYEWSNCDKDSLVRFWKVNNGGHGLIDVNFVFRSLIADFLTD